MVQCEAISGSMMVTVRRVISCTYSASVHASIEMARRLQNGALQINAREQKPRITNTRLVVRACRQCLYHGVERGTDRLR